MLRQELPDFEVVFSNITNRRLLSSLYSGAFKPVKGLRNGQMMDGRRNRLRKDFEEGTLKKVIATSVWATGVDFTQLKWLIRADGMASEIQATQTPGRLSRTSDQKTHGTLIDFFDCFVPSLANRSRMRIRSYKAKGWNVEVLYDPDVSIETFSSLKK
jgi:superfamily II DNA/RNA helicase